MIITSSNSIILVFDSLHARVSLRKLSRKEGGLIPSSILSELDLSRVHSSAEPIAFSCSSPENDNGEILVIAGDVSGNYWLIQILSEAELRLVGRFEGPWNLSSVLLIESFERSASVVVSTNEAEDSRVMLLDLEWTKDSVHSNAIAEWNIGYGVSSICALDERLLLVGLSSVGGCVLLSTESKAILADFVDTASLPCYVAVSFTAEAAVDSRGIHSGSEVSDGMTTSLDFSEPADSSSLQPSSLASNSASNSLHALFQMDISEPAVATKESNFAATTTSMTEVWTIALCSIDGTVSLYRSDTFVSPAASPTSGTPTHDLEGSHESLEAKVKSLLSHSPKFQARLGFDVDYFRAFPRAKYPLFLAFSHRAFLTDETFACPLAVIDGSLGVAAHFQLGLQSKSSTSSLKLVTTSHGDDVELIVSVRDATRAHSFGRAALAGQSGELRLQASRPAQTASRVPVLGGSPTTPSTTSRGSVGFLESGTMTSPSSQPLSTAEDSSQAWWDPAESVRVLWNAFHAARGVKPDSA